MDANEKLYRARVFWKGNLILDKSGDPEGYTRNQLKREAILEARRRGKTYVRIEELDIGDAHRVG